MSSDPVQDLGDAEVRTLVRAVRAILWFDVETGEWDKWMEWDSDTIEAVASKFADAGLCPPEIEDEEFTAAVPR